jgi:predicted nucleotidyltransferase
MLTPPHSALNLKLDAIRAYCAAQPIARLSVFGSVLRADFSADSDIDLLVEFAPGACITYFDLYNMQQAFQSIVGREVDLLTIPALSRYFREDVLSQAQVIYEAR